MTRPQAASAIDDRAVGAESAEFAWRVLNLLNWVRITLGVLLTGVFYAIGDPQLIGSHAPNLAVLALAGMTGTGAAGLALQRRRSLSAATQTYLQFGLDLLMITTLMHASGGISSGLGGLLIIAIGGASLLIAGERAFLLAALTTLVLLLEQTLAQLQGLTTSAQFAPAGILGAVIFVITATVQLLRRRIVESEALAEQRGVDLRNLVELNEYIIRHLRESIIVVDAGNRIRLINESAVNHLGESMAVAGADLAEAAPALDALVRDWRQGRTTRDSSARQIVSADGTAGMQAHFAALGSGRNAGVLIFLEDTSLIAERVQQAKLAALGRLSASIAHEIRNPLGALSHAGQLLAESTGIGDADRRLTDIIRVNSTRVNQIIDSVLALSKRGVTRPESIQIKAWANDFADEFIETQQLYEGAVTVLGGSGDLDVRMDPTHLHQILWNLCDNAVKYASAEAGAIAVELSCGRLDGSSRPYLEVSDRGPGIDEKQADEVFEPFSTGQPGGTGLGLYISRELCERNGASLRYHPRDGGGSTFRIVFADPGRWQASEVNR